MRILHVLAQLPAQTGSGIYYQNLLKGLQGYRHEQRAVFARQDAVEFDFLPLKQQYPVDFCSPELPFPIAGMSDIMPYASTVYGQMSQEMIAAWRTAFQAVLDRAETEFHPQVVILHHLWMLTSLAVETFPSAVKIGVCHNTDLRQAMQNPMLLERYVRNLHRLDAVFALSDMQKASIESLYGISNEKIVVLGGGFDQKLFYPAPANRFGPQIELVYASKIDPAKGVYALLEAFQTVYTTKPHVHLNIVGTPDEKNMKRIRPFLERSLPITLLPAMKQSDLAEFFRSMDLYVMPSFFEGLGLTALEALACGLSVVATENVGLMQLLGDGINKSGVIVYVPLPPMESVDKPRAEGLAHFAKQLSEKMLWQISRIEQHRGRLSAHLPELAPYSWEGIANRVDSEIKWLIFSHRSG